MHLVVEPVAFVGPAIRPDIQPKAGDLIVNPVSGVVTAVLPCVLALTIFLTLLVVAFVLAAVDPGLDSVAVLIVIEPLALIADTVVVNVDAVA